MIDAPPTRSATSLADVPVGVPLERPIYAVGGSAALLAAGRVLTPDHVEALRRAGVHEVVTEPTVPDPAEERSFVARRMRVDDLAGGREAEGVSTPVRLDTAALHALSTAGVEEIEVLVDPRSGGPSEPAAQPGAGRILAGVLRGNRRTRSPEARARDVVVGRRAAEAFDAAIETVAWSAATAELLLASGLRPGFLGPAIETSLMVAIVGARRGWDDDRLVSAAVGGMLADIGMLQIPEDLVFKPSVLSESEHRVMRRHPELGAAVLEPLAAALSPGVADVARMHHERIDGQGYPNGLRGIAVAAEAQVVGMCHLYLAATLGRSYRSPLTPATAISLVERMAGSAWDPRLVRAFVDGIAPYPVGTLVRLSTGECGAVVPGGAGLEPLVEIRWGPDGRVVRPRTVSVDTTGHGVTVVAVGD